MKFEKGQILMGCMDYWEDCYRTDTGFARSRGLEIREKSKMLCQVHVTHIPHFYIVVEGGDEYIKIADLERIRDYHGATSAYYDDPCWDRPDLASHGKTYKRKVYEENGKYYVKPESYIKASLWNGQEEVEYNLH